MCSAAFRELRFLLKTILWELPLDTLFRFHIWWLYDLHLRTRRFHRAHPPESELGFDAVLTTTTGIYLTNGDRTVRLLNGHFTGLTRYAGCFFAAEERSRLKRSRIISFRLDGARAVAVRGFYTSPNRGGFHQIDFVGPHLHITDTNNNRIIVLDSSGRVRFAIYPNHVHAENRRNQELDPLFYNHYNSLLARGDNLFVLANNATNKSGRPSQVYALALDSLNARVVPGVDGSNSHNILMHSGALLICDSLNGELVDKARGRVVFRSQYFTRGLAMNEKYVLLGGSDLARRKERDDTSSRYWVLNRDFRIEKVVDLGKVGQIFDIRLLDVDYGLSNESAQGDAEARGPCLSTPTAAVGVSRTEVV